MAEKKKNNFMTKAAAFIVDKRNVFFILYLFAFAFCMFAMGWVHVENDVTKYLPEDAEIRLGIDAMNANFAVTGTGRVMVSNVTYETAEQIFEAMSELEGIAMVLNSRTSVSSTSTPRSMPALKRKSRRHSNNAISSTQSSPTPSASSSTGWDTNTAS